MRDVSSGLTLICGSAVFALLTIASAVCADGMISGNAWIERVKDQPNGYVALYEWNAYLSKDGGGVEGRQFRVGPFGMDASYYEFTHPGGTYTILVDQPLFWGRPTVYTDVVLPASGSTPRDLEPPTDYSCLFGGNMGVWGSDPWTRWASTWYQTFVATGTSITGVSFKLAGSYASSMQITIHEDNGENVTTWPQVGVARVRTNVGPLADQWVRYRSGEIPTVPGQRYALKLNGQGMGATDFSVFRRIEDGLGYADGRACDGAGQPQNFDLYAMIFSDNDGTVVPYACLTHEEGSLAGWAGTWWQEVKAVGDSLAGVTIYFAAGDWDIPLNFEVHSNSPTGVQIGPTKVGRGAFQAANSGIAGASWAPDEVMLVPGQTYFIEVSGNPGLNAAQFTRVGNSYPHGAAWYLSPSYEAVRLDDVDLFMQIVEYIAPPTLYVTPTTVSAEAECGTNPLNTPFIVRNTGAGEMAYTITADVPWLSVSPAEGTSSGELDAIRITYDTAGLSMGIHNGTITVASPNAENSPIMIDVTLEMTEPTYARADCDRDGDVDQEDFGTFQACHSGVGNAQMDPDCACGRLDMDEDVDPDDLELFHGCMSGANVPADPMCAGGC